MHFDSMVPKCFPSYAFHSVIQKALRWEKCWEERCILLSAPYFHFFLLLFFVQGWLGIMSFQMDKIK